MLLVIMFFIVTSGAIDLFDCRDIVEHFGRSFSRSDTRLERLDNLALSNLYSNSL